MLKLTDVELTDVVNFKKVKLDILRHPFTVITGHNRDSRISTETSNGAGKSLLLSSVPNLRYEAAPLATSKSKKDMLETAKSSIRIGLVGNDGKPYSITQTNSKFIIECDGKDKEVRTIPLQKKEIERIFPLTEDEFYSYVYLQSQRPLSFQSDKPAARLQYITSLFQLDVYDRLKQHFTKKLGEIKNKQVEFDVVNAQLVKINGILERLDWSKEKAQKLDEAKGVIKELGDESKKLHSKIEKLKSAIAASERIAKLKKQRKKLKPKLSRKAAQAELQLHEDLAEYESDLKSFRAQVKQYTNQLTELGEVSEPAVLKAHMAKIEKELEKEEAWLTEAHGKRQQIKQIAKDLAEAEEDYKSLGGKLKEVNVTVAFGTAEFERVLLQYQPVMQLASIVDDCADGECPTCQQSVNVKKFKKQITEAKGKIKEAKQSIKIADAAIVLAKLRTKSRKLEFNEEEFVSRRENYRKRDAKLDSLKEKLNDARQAQKLKERLGELKQPKAPKAVPKHTRKDLRAMLDDHAEIKRIDSVLESLLEDYGTIDIDSLSNKLAEAEKRYAKVERSYSRAQDVVSSYGSKASEYKVLKRERTDALEKLEDLKPIIAQRDLIKSLEKAYSAKGLKVNAANEILFQIEEQLNRNSHLIFAEPFKFNVFAKENGVHCIVDRGNGKKPTDVRLLSGAESDCFRLLWFYVMLIMVEDDRRTNFAVLDEPDSHMDPTTRSLFVERYLPALRSLVPHVFLITPLDKHLYTECAYLTVVKHKGVSQVMENYNEDGELRVPRARRSAGEAESRKGRKAKPSANGRARRKAA